MSEEKSYSQIRNEFYKNFREKCVPILQSFEVERKKIIQKIVLVLVLLAIVISIGVIYVFTSTNGRVSETHKDAFIFIMMTSFALGLFGYKAILKSFERKIKVRLMPVLCSCFPKLKWVKDASVKHSLYKSAGIITRDYNREYVDDVFQGSFKDVPFEIVEVEYQKVTRTTDSKGRTRTNVSTVFDGIIITLAMNKNFSSHTLVKSDSLFKSSGISDLKHTTLEDVNFEKKYDVYTNDEVEARYLLTTSLMERLTQMKTIYKSKTITSAFYKDKFIIAMDVRRDMFKLGSLFKKADDERQYFQMYEEIISIIKLIDHFKLDQKIGL